jgi:hypothetical protein
MLPAAQSLSNALNALLPPALCQCLITLDSQQEASPALLAQWALAQRQMEAGVALLRVACQDPALAAQAGQWCNCTQAFRLRRRSWKGTCARKAHEMPLPGTPPVSRPARTHKEIHMSDLISAIPVVGPLFDLFQKILDPQQAMKNAIIQQLKGIGEIGDASEVQGQSLQELKSTLQEAQLRMASPDA